MGNDIQISVRVSNDTGAGLAAVNTSLQGLKNNAQQAGQALHGLTGRSSAASQSLHLLDNRAESATNALQGLRAAAGDIRVTASIDDQTASNITSIKSALRDLKRESPVRLTAQFDGDSGQIAAAATAMRDLRGDANGAGTALTGLTTRSAAAAAALNSLEQQAEEASRALRTLRGRAAAAAAAMGEFRDRVTAVTAALRTFNTRAQTADGRLNTLSASTRTLRGDMDDLDSSVGRLAGNLGGLRGNLGSLRSSSASASGGIEGLRAAAGALASALIPIAATAVPIAAGLGAAGVAVAAFGVAIGGQIAKVMEAAEAEKKYRDAVKEHGTGSAEAAKAAQQIQLSLKGMPQATQEAAAGLGLMKEEYREWSDSLADSTMPVATKAFANFGALLPKLTPLVRGASTELDRMMTVIAGGIQSEGFERFMASFAEFAAGALSKATTGLVKFFQALDTGEVGRGLSEFMDYAREVGPAVGETLGNLAKAMMHLVAGASDLGVSVLGAVNALAELVNAIPTSVLSNMLQLYVTLKLVSVGVAALGAVTGGAAVARLAAYFAVMRAAGVGTTLRATAASMTAMTKATIGLGVLAVAAIGISKLAENARGAPPDVDRLTTSLKNLATTGKMTGELKATFGDFDGLIDKMKKLTAESDKASEAAEGVFGFRIPVLDDIGGWFGDAANDMAKGSESLKALKEDFKGVDEALAQLASSGSAETAAAGFDLIRKAGLEAGYSTKEINALLPEYKAALANVRAEQELAAAGMGLFGQQAMDVQSKLAAQKSSADGLAQSINALSDAALTARGSFRGMEAAMDAADEAFKKNGETLDEGTEKGRANNEALDALAAATKKAAVSARENGASWQKVNGIYDRGRSKLIEVADQMGLTKSEAKKLADQILRTPNKTARLKGNMEDLEAKLKTAKSKLGKVPDSRKAKLRAEIAALNAAVAAAKRAIDSVRGKTVTITANLVDSGMNRSRWSNGVLVRAEGGPIEGGSGIRDDVPVLAMGGEYIVNKESTSKHRALLEAINEDRLPKFAKGGKVSKQQQAERAARSGAQGDLTISHFGKMAGYQRSEFGSALAKADSIGSLVNALNQWRGIIMKATSGRTEKNLLRQLDSTGKALLKQERALSKVTDQLDKAKSKLADLKNAAASLASSVKNNILGSANITKGAGGEGRITTASIMGGLTSSRDKATAFAQALKDLQKKGLSKDLLQQVAEAGIDGGGLETATALLGASSSEIKSMNDLQAQITKAATAAGKVTADAVYGAQIKAQERTVKALKSVQEKLTKSMDNLTKAMEKAIEKAFGTKATGGIVGAAASGGVRGGWTVTGEQGPELIRIPVGSRVYPTGQSRRMAWESMLTTSGRDTTRPVARPAASQAVQPIVVHQTITLDGKVVARQIFDPMRDEVLRRTGGDVQKALGRN